MSLGLNKLSHCFFILSMLVIHIGCGSPRIDLQSPFLVPVLSEPMIPADYLIGKGDELEIMYYIDPGSSVQEYLIDTEDTVRIDFYYYPVLNKTARVRPDGCITLQRLGDVKAAGIAPHELADKISEFYKPFISRPDVTVEVIDFNVKVENLKATIKTTTRGQSKRVVVRPDGKISLPYVHDFRAEGLTCLELSQDLEANYRNFVKNISISTAMLKAGSNRAYIMGEVAHPNFYELPGPVTLTQFIAGAGGFSQNANTHQIMIIRRGKQGQPEAVLLDMNDIIGRGNMQSDPVIRQYDVIFVPKTSLSEAALAMEYVWSLIPLRFSASYSLGGTDAN